MSNVLIEFHEDTQTVFCLYVTYHDGDFLCVQYISKGDLVEYRLSLSHVQAIESISSLDELLAYARANNNIKSYSKNHNQDTSLREETLCPCLPEVSEHIPDTDKAETDGDSFSDKYVCTKFSDGQCVQWTDKFVPNPIVISPNLE